MDNNYEALTAARRSSTPVVGRVIATSASFKGDVFKPINTAQGTFHPTAALGFGMLDAYLPPLAPGEFFQILEDSNKSDGYGGRFPAGNYVEYEDAYRAAAGLGVQGSRGEVQIVTPAGFTEMTVTAHDGTKVIVAQTPRFRTSNVSDRLVFSKPYTANPEL